MIENNTDQIKKKGPLVDIIIITIKFFFLCYLMYINIEIWLGSKSLLNSMTGQR